ncbi:MAG: hypothetical protein AB7S81_07365 [Bdellovibrionales bacterium]
MANILPLSQYGAALLSPVLSNNPLFEDISALYDALGGDSSPIKIGALEECLSSGQGPTPVQHLTLLNAVTKKLNGTKDSKPSQATKPQQSSAESYLNQIYEVMKGAEAATNFIYDDTREILKDIKPQFADIYIFLFRAEFARTGAPFVKNIYTLAKMMAPYIRKGERKRTQKAIEMCLYKAFSKKKETILALDVLRLLQRTVETTVKERAVPAKYASDIFYPLYKRLIKETYPDDQTLGWWLTVKPFGEHGEHLVESAEALAKAIRERHPVINYGLSDDRFNRGCMGPSNIHFRPLLPKRINMICDFVEERLKQIEGIENLEVHLARFYNRADDVLRAHNPDARPYKRPDRVRGVGKTALYKIFCINKYGEESPLFNDEEDFINQLQAFSESEESRLIEGGPIRLAFRKPENLFGLNKRYVSLIHLFIRDISKSPEQNKVLTDHFLKALTAPSSSPEDIDVRVSTKTEVGIPSKEQIERSWQKTCFEILKTAGIKAAPLCLIKHEGTLIAPHMKAQPPKLKKMINYFLTEMVHLGIPREQAKKFLAPNVWHALNVAVKSKFTQQSLKQLEMS